MDGTRAGLSATATRRVPQAHSHDCNERQPVVIRVRNSYLQHAIKSVLADTDWQVKWTPSETAPTPIVAEPALWAPGRPDTILVLTASTPLACRGAVSRILRSEAVGAVTAETIEDLVAALEAQRMRRVHLTSSMLARATLVPSLTTRQTAVLRALLAGQDVDQIAGVGCVSASTVKRTLSDLLARHGVHARSALLRHATELGYEARALTGVLP